jgi:hypothetical protein
MKFETNRDVLPLMGAAFAGAAAMWLLEPGRGRRRRHLIADQFTHAGHVAADTISTTRRDLANRTRGAVAEVRARFEHDEADDIVISERIRAELGRVVSHPAALQVAVSSGRVILNGDVLEHEAKALLARVRHVRGVVSVEDRVRRQVDATSVSSLQGGEVRAARRAEHLREHWPPSARLVAGLAGGALVAFALGNRRGRDAAGALLGLAGFALVARSASNKPLRDLIGIGRRPISVEKAVTIAATPDDSNEG